MTDQAFLKEDLIELRSSLGLTQQEMADRLDMAMRSYQAIEAGESSYRYIHRLAAERVAMMVAVDQQSPMLAPDPVRRDAIDLVRMGQLIGRPEFQILPTNAKLLEEKKNDAGFRAAYGVVGELVLIANALDSQINHVMMQVLHLTNSPMLEPVIATLDVSRKVEMIKARAKHIGQADWRKGLTKYLDKLETVFRLRNLACHSPLIPDAKHGAVFAPTAAAKLLKTLQVGEAPNVERTPIGNLRRAISAGEHALKEGQNLIENFERLNAERERRSKKTGRIR